MRGRLHRFALWAALAIAAALPSASVAEGFSGGQAMSFEELDEVRGGMITPTGLEIGFGAVVRTFVDGSLALQTRLTWTESGPVETVEYGMTMPDITTAAAAGGVFLNGPALEGVVVNGDGGVTAISHSITGEHITHLVINNANNREIRQSTDITVDIPGLAQLQQDIAFQVMDLRLQDSIRIALRDAAGP